MAARPRQTTLPAPLMKPLSILLVEDEEDLRTLFAATLKRAAHHVATASSIRAAITAMGTFSFDVVVTDLLMPDGHGTEVVVAANAAAPHARIIVISGDAGQLIPGTWLAAGSDNVSVLAKPFTPARLLSLLSAEPVASG